MSKFDEEVQLSMLVELLAQTEEFDFPFCLEEHTDKPDFVISTRSRQIGLEVTSYTDTEIRWAEKLAHRMMPGKNYNRTGLRDRDPMRKRDEVLATMASPRPEWEQCGWGANHTITKILNSLEEKIECIRHKDFIKLPENWVFLSEYRDCMTPWFARELTPLLHEALRQTGLLFQIEFDRVFIQSFNNWWWIKDGELHTAFIENGHLGCSIGDRYFYPDLVRMMMEMDIFGTGAVQSEVHPVDVVQ